MNRRHATPLSYLKNSSILRHAAYFSLAFGVVSAHDANALPAGGTVVGGTADITYNGANTKVTIDQSSQRGVIDWNNFNISSGETAKFNQPNSSAITLNRVLDGNPTSIYGKLTANGQIIVQNASGIYFGPGSKVDVGGLIATTANTDNASFMAGGNLNFNQAGNNKASVINAGTITAAEGGLIALVAPGVENRGVISAKLGTVQLASAKTVAVDFYGDNLYSFSLGDRTNQKPKDETGTDMDALVKNTGNIDGQYIYMTAKAAQGVVNNVINTSGIVEASGARMEGGTIVLDGGNNGNVRVSGTVKAQSKNGKAGGDISIKGDSIELAGATIDATGSTQGGSVDIGHKVKTNTVSMDGTSSIDVSATDNGNGGDVSIWSATNTTLSSGSKILGKGGVNGGNGGTAEVSSAGTLVFNGLANLSTYLGSAGRLLIDPFNLTVDSGLASALVASLNTGTDVEATADNDITVSSIVDWTGIGNLVLSAAHDIILNATLRSRDAVNGGTKITLNAGNDVSLNTGLVRGLLGGVAINSTNLTINGVGSAILSQGGNIDINNSGVFKNNSGINDIIFSNGATSHVYLRQNAGAGSSIQNAIDAIGNTGTGGAKVTLGAGTWTEQVSLGQNNFTLTGAGDSTVIQAPSLLATQFSNGDPTPIKPIVYAHDADNITLSNFKVDGANLGNDNYRMVGVAFNNAGGTIDHTTITNLQNDPFSGVQSGYGIYGYNSTGNHTIAATNNTINNFQKNGMRFEGAGLTANASDNTITGNGATGLIAQNGIVFMNGALGSAVHNTISGIGYTGSNASATGILLYSAGNGVVVDNNNITGTGYDNGIAAVNSSGAQITNNNISNSDIGINLDSGSNQTVTGNDVTDSNIGIGAYALTGTNSITGNTLTGNDTGLESYDTAGLDFNHNTISGGSTGVYLNNTDDALINDNDFLSVASSGIYLDNSDNVAIAGGSITGAGTGIYSNSDLTQVSGVAIDNHGIGGAVGVKFDGATNGSVVGGSVKGGTIGVGIYNNSDNSFVSGVTLEDLYVGIDAVNASNVSAFFNTLSNVANGIVATNVTGNVSLLANTIGSWNGEGITLTNTDGATLYNNLITFGGNTGTGITIKGGSDNTDIKGGKITGATTGVSVANGTGNKIESLTVQGGQTGIYLTGATDTDIQRSTLTGSTGTSGILAENGSTGLWAWKNDISGYGTGITLSAVSHNAELLENTIAGGNGIDVQSSDNLKADKNKLDVAGNGISFLNGKDAAITSNTITSPASHTANATAITVFGATGDVTVNGNTITNPSDKRGITIANTADAEVKGNTITGGARGIRLSNAAGADVLENTVTGATFGISSSNSDNLELTDNILSGGDTAIYLDNSNKAKVTGGTITGTQTGIQTNSNKTQISNVAINNSGIGGSVGVKFDGATNGSVSGGSVSGGSIGVGIYNGSKNTTVDGGVTLSNLYVGVDAVGAKTINVSDNSFDNNANSVFVNNVTGDITVDGNTITQYAAQDGIHILASKNAMVTDNTISGGAHGVWIDGSNNATVSGGSITNATTGVRVNPSTGVTIDGVSITGGTTGVELIDSADATVKNTTLTNSDTAVYASGSTGLDLFGNTISAIKQGIHLVAHSDGANIHDNTNIAGKRAIVVANSDDARIHDNASITGNQGIVLNNSDNATVKDNAITASIVGIKAASVKGLELVKNIIGGADTGIDIADSNGTIALTRNSITGNSSDTGIAISNTKNAVLDRDDIDISAAGTGTGTGIRLTNANGTDISGNGTYGFITNASGSAANGIMVDNSDNVTVDGITINGGGTAISFLNGSDNGKVFDSTLNDLTVGGINATGGDGFKAEGNTITNASQGGILVSQVTGNIALTNNDIDGTLLGIVIDRSNDAKITGGNITNSTAGIVLSEANGTEINDVTVKHGFVGVGILGGENTTVKKSHFDDLFAGVGAIMSKNVSVLGNEFKKVGTGVALLGVTGNDNHVNNNSFTKADTAILLSGSNQVEVGSNDIEKSGTGIWVQASNNTDIHGGSITDTDNSIVVESGSNHTDINDVTIDGGKVGITVTSGSNDTSITGNHIRNQKTGVQVADGSSKVLIEDNRFRDNKTGVDAANSSNVSVIDNIFRGEKTAIAFENILGGNIRDNDLKALATGNNGITLDGGNDIAVRDNTLDGYANAINADIVGSLKVTGNTVTDGNTTIKRSDGVLVRGNHISNGDILVGNSDDAIINNNDVTGGTGIGITLRNSERGTVTGNTVIGRTLGYLVQNVQGLLFRGNTAETNDTGAQFTSVSDGDYINNRILENTLNGVEASDLQGANFDDNLFRRNGIDGLTISDSSGVVLTGNRMVRNGRGVVLTNVAGATLTGDVFTNNVLGLDIIDSPNTVLDGVAFNMSAGDYGMRIFSTGAGLNTSTGTLVGNTAFNGGEVAVTIDGTGSDMQFVGDTSSFTGNNYYFVLQNGAMAGQTLDASQQTFDGTRAIDFTYQQMIDAEDKTVDDDSTLALGDVFYSDVLPEGLSSLEELQKKRKLFRSGLFSYAGKTLANANEPVKATFAVGEVNLSLLNGGNNAQNATALIANRFANLAPAAGGGKPGKAVDFANLNPAAGGPSSLNVADQGFGNSFLGDGFKAGFGAQ